MTEFNLSTIKFFIHIAVVALQSVLDLIAKIDPNAVNNPIYKAVKEVLAILSALEL